MICDNGNRSLRSVSPPRVQTLIVDTSHSDNMSNQAWEKLRTAGTSGSETGTTRDLQCEHLPRTSPPTEPLLLYYTDDSTSREFLGANMGSLVLTKAGASVDFDIRAYRANMVGTLILIASEFVRTSVGDNT